MKKNLFAACLLSCVSFGFCAEEPAQKPEQPAPKTDQSAAKTEQTAPKTEQPAPKEELKSPFNIMTPSELVETGIKKLSGAEQEALAKWWSKQKNHPQLHIAKEVNLTAIQDDGKYIVLSDGTRLSVAKSYRKKIAKWVVGDKIGIGGEAGRRGSVTIYHMPTGQKIKAKRDQAPKKADKHK